eukprot:g6745.t1
MADDAEIGSQLSDNESITVRLPTAAAGIQQGGKWGRSKRSKTTPTAATTAATRTSSRAYRPPSSAAAGATSAGGGDGGKDSKKANGKGKKANERSTASRGHTSGEGETGRRAAGGGCGVHTLGGPVTPPAASPRGGAAGGRRGQASSRGGGSSPGQVRTLFDSSASTSGRAGGSTGASAAAAAAARRAGGAAAPGGGEPDAVAAAVAAAGGETSSGGPPNRKRPRSGKAIQLKSEGDIAERLLTAVAGGGKGTADRFFRKAMKLAVDKQYDQSRADARVRAALGGWYTAKASATQRRLGDGESVALNISFSKGAGTKSQLTETVDRIPREQVSAVVRMIARDPESREMLKPHNFAGCSPRMFWSLVQHWGGDVPAALRLAAPDVDWSFLDSRDRKPSEKAVANAAAAEEERRQAEQERAEREKAKRKKERRKRRKEGIETDSSDEEDGNQEEETVEVVPAPAAGGGHGEEEGSEAARAADARRRAANAALARLTASQHRPTAGAAAVTSGASSGAAAAGGVSAPPEETGRDASMVEKAESEEVDVEVDLEGLTEVVGEPGAKLLIAAGVKTIGQLADRDEDELSRALAVLQQKQQQEAGVSAESAADGSGSSGEGHTIDAEQVSEWVQSARGEELDEIMADILEGDEDVVEALEQVSVSTPRDLVRLGAFPDVLVGAVRDQLGAELFAPLAGRITADAVDSWRRKGDCLLEQRPWLELWVHGR